MEENQKFKNVSLLDVHIYQQLIVHLRQTYHVQPIKKAKCL